MKRLLAGTGVLSVALFAALGILSKGWLEPEGLPIFDARLVGYDLTAAQAYLQGLTEDARELYLGLFRWLDSLLPVALFLTLAGLLWQGSAGHWVPLRALIMCLPVLYLVADLLENAQVAEMLRAGVPLDAAMVRVASTYTQMKWLSLGLCFVMIMVGWLARRGKQE